MQHMPMYACTCTHMQAHKHQHMPMYTPAPLLCSKIPALHGPRAPRSPLAQPRCIQQVGAGLGAEAGAELKGKAPKPQLGPPTGLMDTRQWR